MKKLMSITAILMLFLAIESNAQWSYKVVESEFDGNYKKAYVSTKTNDFLIMEENIDSTVNSPFLALYSTYFCDDDAKLDIAITVDSMIKKYSANVTKSKDSKYYFFENQLWTDEFTRDFTSANSMSIRVNQSYCDDKIYRFVMTNSGSAYNFIMIKK